jgi:hypothetical protein
VCQIRPYSLRPFRQRVPLIVHGISILGAGLLFQVNSDARAYSHVTRYVRIDGKSCGVADTMLTPRSSSRARSLAVALRVCNLYLHWYLSLILVMFNSTPVCQSEQCYGIGVLFIIFNYLRDLQLYLD